MSSLMLALPQSSKLRRTVLPIIMLVMIGLISRAVENYAHTA